METLKIFGAAEESAVQQIQRCIAGEEGARGVLCADNHKGYSQPIGGAVAYRNHISPSGVGYDIACGNKAVKTNLKAADVPIKPMMDRIFEEIEFGVGRSNPESNDHPVFDAIAKADFAPQRTLLDLARNQLGTVGSGNHYVDLFEDEKGWLWVGVHFGSRGFGHRTATGFLSIAQGGSFTEHAKEGEMDSPPVLLSLDSQAGQDYIVAMHLAGEYAYAGRDWVADKVLRILGARAVEQVHNHHNFCVAGDQKIPTPDGFKRMRDLAEGDVVYAFDPATGLVPTHVLSHWLSGNKAIYTIRTRNRELRVSGNHPIQVVRVSSAPHPERPWMKKRQGHLEWVCADTIRAGDIIVCAEGYYAGDRSIGEEIARLIGAFLGDGWVRHTHPEVSGYSVGLAIGGAGESHTEKYADLCGTVFGDADWKTGSPGAFGVSCSSRSTYDRLAGLGVSSRSRDKAIPYFAYRMPLNEKLALLSGYFDADGHVADGCTSNHGRGTIASVSRALVEGLREIAIACGLQVTPIQHSHRITNFGECDIFLCRISADGMSQLTLWHEGKASRQRATQYKRPQGLESAKIGYISLPDGLFAQTVQCVTISAPEEVFDITVEHDSHSFVCEGVVVHNCWKEKHFGEDYWVVRKGCTPANPGQKGFVGGSMGDISVILEGVEGQDSKEGLYSTVHGAGRVMSRTQAAGKKKWIADAKGKKRPQIISPGLIDWPAVQASLKKQGIELRGGGADEAPGVYKSLQSVLQAHGSTIKILHTLKPLGVAMAEIDTYDPYKD